ncbi:MAG: phosphonate C-P lyase system protein PhnG [Variovorax sp.]
MTATNTTSAHSTHSPQSLADVAQRADWLRLLALATGAELARCTKPVLADFRFEWLRPPEHGLVMVRSRIGNTGDRFNVGEATVTRCAVRHQAADGRTTVGVGHVMGVDAERAERVAQVDALLQVPALHGLLEQGVLHELRTCIEQRHRAQQARTESSRVRFFTLQPEKA